MDLTSGWVWVLFLAWNIQWDFSLFGCAFWNPTETNCGCTILPDKVTEFCDTIERERRRFSPIYDDTASPVHPAQGDRTYHQQLHSNILDNILIRNRFQDHEKWMFLSLLDPQHFQTYRKKSPQTASSSLTGRHGTLFDLSKLKTELTVMYAVTHFEGKSPSDLLDFLKQKHLNEDTGRLHTLACVTVTICVHGFCRALILRLKANQTVFQKCYWTDWAFSISLHVERKGLIGGTKRTDRVIEVFLRKERRMDFVFKYSVFGE